MAVSASQVLYVLKLLKDLPDKAKAIKTVKVDGKNVADFEITNIDLDLGSLELEMEYRQQEEASTTKLYAKHIFRSDQPDVITIDSHQVDDDEVDLDIDLHLLRADIEYRLHYTDQGAPHEIFMLASVNWFSV